MIDARYRTHLHDAERLALAILREDYARGRIGFEDFDHRTTTILGQHGSEQREYALSTTDWCDITTLGDVQRQYVAASWYWPS